MNFTWSPRWKKAAFVLGGVGLLAIGAGAGGYYQSRRAENQPAVVKDGKREGDSVHLPARAGRKNQIENVTVARVRPARDVELVGSVGFAADHYAQVGPLIAGRIVSFRSGIGSKVKAGQVLAELESAEVLA